MGIYPASAFVFIYDNMICSATTFSCGFSQQSLTVSAGTTVVWQNTGHLTHSAVSNATLNVGLESFSSGPLSPKQSFTHVFVHPALYHYYDGNYNFLRDTVDVAAPA